eukprot:TRINITY_DN100495_c0_g1_i1.p1 TRINITY_DN100495_c0_g1~~TRINITY_DN100495_c0_g1_i1.p1  ORF type:complete len:1729 (+),score=209.29 TRINITY_DN100495_c0_g1_i1:76-5262(+)
MLSYAAPGVKRRPAQTRRRARASRLRCVSAAVPAFCTAAAVLPFAEAQAFCTGAPTGRGVDAQDCVQRLPGQSCLAKCREGFVPRAESYVCDENYQWTGNELYCEPARCVRGLPNVEGADTADCDGAAVGDSCGVTCAEGYETQLSVMVCEKDLAFHGPPFAPCQRRQCFEDGFPVGLGLDTGKCKNLFFRDKCQVRCRPGFTPVGEATGKYECGADGLLYGSGPECEETRCDKGLPEGVDGVDTTSCWGLRAGKSCMVTCDFGYAPDSQEFKCQNDGVFRGKAPRCNRRECLSKLPYGRGVDGSDCKNRFLGDTCTAKCRKGFKGETTTYICQEDGTFRGVPPKCHLVGCADIPQELSWPGIVHNCTGRMHGQACNAWCGEGYKGSPGGWQCMGGKLEGKTPKCHRVKCLRGIPGGDGVDASDCKGKSFEKTCQLKCLPGFLPKTTAAADATLTCGSDGSFSASKFECERQYCEDMATVPAFNKPAVGSTCHKVKHGHTCSITCAAGYSLSEREAPNWPKVLQCDMGGQFARAGGYKEAATGKVAAAPPCSPDECTGGIPASPGMATDCKGKKTGQTCRVKATPGYSANKETTLTCQSSGFFTGELPIVTALSCSLPAALQAPGVMSTCDGMTTGKKCLAYCESGKEGVVEYVCSPGNPPVLKPVSKPVSCQVPEKKQVDARRLAAVPNVCDAAVTAAGLDTIPYSTDCDGRSLSAGEVVACIVVCAEGFEPSPGTNLLGEVYMCHGDGTISGTQPSCQPKTCFQRYPDGFGVTNNCDAKNSGTGTKTFETCEAVCDQGYEPATSSVFQTYTCQQDGGFDGTAMQCRGAPCDPLTVAVEFQHDCDGVRTDGNCFVTCAVGWTLAGSVAQWTCQASGSVTGTDPTCNPNECLSSNPDIFNNPNYNSDCTGTRTLETCSVTCGDGFTPIAGDATWTCQATGIITGTYPLCQASLCPDLVPPRGRQSNCQGVRFQETCFVTCAPEWILSGNTPGEMECSWDAAITDVTLQYNGNPEVCVATKCEYNIPNDPMYSHDCDPAILTGETCVVRCVDGYYVTADSTKTLVCPSGSLDGELTGTLPTCDPMPCPQISLPDLNESACSAAAYFFNGPACPVSCDYGFIPSSGPAVVQYFCQWDSLSLDVKMTGPAVDCIPAPCADNVPTGRGVEHNCQLTGTGMSCTAKCQDGYVNGTVETFTCQANGVFIGTSPVCEPETCPPRIIDGIQDTCGYNASQDSRYLQPSTFDGPSCVASCLPGWAAYIGPRKTLWSCGWNNDTKTVEMQGDVPQCQREVCTEGLPGWDTHENDCLGTVFEGTCNVSCGFGFIGNASVLTCDIDRTFIGEIPNCSATTTTTSTSTTSTTTSAPIPICFLKDLHATGEMEIRCNDVWGFFTNDTVQLNAPDNLFGATAEPGPQELAVIEGFFPPFDEFGDPAYRRRDAIILLTAPLNHTYENGTRVAVAIPYPRVPFAGGDPITFYRGQKVKFWLPNYVLLPMVKSNDLNILASTFQGPTEDLQWFERIVVTLPDDTRLVQITVKRSQPPRQSVKRVRDSSGEMKTLRVSNATAPKRRLFESLEILLGDATEPLKHVTPQVYTRPASAHSSALRIGVGDRPESHPRASEMTSPEVVYIESADIAFAIMAVAATAEFPSDYYAAHENKHLDLFIMDVKNEHTFSGVLPELWGVQPMSAQVRDMLKAPSQLREDLVQVEPVADALAGNCTTIDAISDTISE